MRWGVAGLLTVAACALAGVALAASSFSDVTGDTNEAPDVTSVTVSHSPAGMLTVTVAVGNFQTLPASSWLNLWFDLDSNASTGDEGDEALVRFLADGTLQFFRWSGTELATRPTDGMTATYAAGVLTFQGPAAAFDDATSLGILAVASRSQQVEQSEYVAADFAPNDGRSAYTGPGPTSFPDPGGDHPAAPDVTSVRVSDSKDGMISFAIATGNFETLPTESLVVLLIDRDGRQSTGAGGSDAMILYQSGEILLARWNQASEEFVLDDPPSRIAARNAGGVLTLSVHRSELGNLARFGFAVGAGHLGADDVLDAFDVAPEELFWRYTLANKPALHLIAGKAKGAPVRPVAGRQFTITVPVTRSDTGRTITSGSAKCSVRVAGKSVSASGRVSAGTGRCAFVVPASASGKQVTGTIVVRSGGKTVTVRFAFAVR